MLSECFVFVVLCVCVCFRFSFAPASAQTNRLSVRLKLATKHGRGPVGSREGSPLCVECGPIYGAAVARSSSVTWRPFVTCRPADSNFPASSSSSIHSSIIVMSCQQPPPRPPPSSASSSSSSSSSAAVWVVHQVRDRWPVLIGRFHPLSGWMGGGWWGGLSLSLSLFYFIRSEEWIDGVSHPLKVEN